MTPRHMSSAIAAALAVPALALGLTAAAAGNTAAGHAAARHGRAALTAKAASSTRTVVVSCPGKAQVRPGGFVLACADGNDYLTGLSWTSWTPDLASAKGTEHLNDCTPDCAQGKFHTYPALTVLWGGAAVSHHPGEKRYTEITLLYPGARPPVYKNGKMVPGPRVVTRSLWS
ncbi:MAG TPA: hypothetical protein VKV80_17305 [Streptosporangiaceae bacterium]|nr:hypothetical protein [Streptosporangiaceae bacterium]